MSTGLRAKISAVLEASLAFGLIVFLFGWVRSIPFGRAASHQFAAYAVLLAAAGLLYRLRSASQSESQIPGKLRNQGIVFAYGFFPVLILSVALTWLDWKHWPGAAVISALSLLMLVWFAWMSRGKPAWQETAFLSGGLLLSLSPFSASRPLDVLLAIVYYYLFVGLAEETLFRGYIQARLNAAFGRPNRFFGIPWGWGLIIASLFFGLWHLDWAALSNWPHVLWTAFAGLLFGLIREKGNSIIAPALLHGVLNYGPQAILFALFFS